MAGTSAQLRRLGAEIRRRRQAAGVTQVQLAAALGRTHVSVVNWERGKTRISKSDLAYLLAELQVPMEVRNELERLRQDTGTRRGWWSEYELGAWLRPLVNFEQDAAEITSFEPIVVPGLLQTREYARALHVGGPYNVPQSEVDSWVEARMQRQRRLAEPDPVRLHAIIAEAALRTQIGDAEVMATQLAHLAKAAESHAVTLQLVPRDAGAHSGTSGGWTVLHFADSEIDPPLGYIDGPLGGHLIDSPGDVASLIKMFDDVARHALSETASRKLLREVTRDQGREAASRAQHDRPRLAQVEP